eukprot:4859907-Amphidinium_carterae.2
MWWIQSGIMRASFTTSILDKLTQDDVIGHVSLDCCSSTAHGTWMEHGREACGNCQDSNDILPSGFEGELDLLDNAGRQKGSLKLKVSFVKRATSEAASWIMLCCADTGGHNLRPCGSRW